MGEVKNDITASLCHLTSVDTTAIVEVTALPPGRQVGVRIPWRRLNPETRLGRRAAVSGFVARLRRSAPVKNRGRGAPPPPLEGGFTLVATGEPRAARRHDTAGVLLDDAADPQVDHPEEPDCKPDPGLRVRIASGKHTARLL